MGEKKKVKGFSKEIKLNGGVWIKDKIIGEGGCGTVYLAKSVLHHLDDEDDDSIKNPPLIAVKSVELWGPKHDDLSQECEILLEMKPSPHIIQLLGEYYTSEKEGEIIFDLCFEYAPGGSLHDLIRRTNGGEGLDEMEVRHYTHSILKGLKHMHDQEFVHCDLKPQNILLCENNVAKIADFGLSVRRDRLSHIGRNFVYRGTYLYVAPEEINSQSYETISDIWGLGCIVLETLSGKQPWSFDPETDEETRIQYIAKSDALPTMPKKLSPLAKDFLSHCFVRDTKVRWNADKLLEHPFIQWIKIDTYANGITQKLREELGVDKRKRKREAEEEEEMLKKMKRGSDRTRRCAEMIEALNANNGGGNYGV